MQLVAMVPVAMLVLVLVRAGQGCSYDCRMIPTQITLEECGNVTIHTTICAGQCYLKATVYRAKDPRYKQRSCDGEWSYEVANIEGCPEGVTYPVATNCWCTTCEESSTACYSSAMSSCLAD